jgi:poly-gamma-glutamate synthesis protein (capsule biosynthesis protein)
MRSKIALLLMLAVMLASLTGLGYVEEEYASSTALPAYSDALQYQMEVTVNNTSFVISDETMAPASTEIYAPVIVKAQPEAERLRIVAVGDINLGRGVGMKLEKDGKEYTYAFEKVASILKKGDVVFGNLEAPHTDSTRSLTGLREGGKIVLKARVKAFEAIRYAGFNLLSIANNHILDMYDTGLYDSIELMRDSNIAFSGAGSSLDEARKAAIVEKRGVRIGLISYTDMAEVLYKGNPPIRFIAGKDRYGVAPRKLEMIKQDIELTRGNVDLLLVSLHWGIEESFDIAPEQIEFAHTLIDCGADAVLGHHPHQFQGMEVYKGKPIIYSLGNFIFDQNDPENQESFIVNLDFTDRRLSGITAIPVRTFEKCHVKLVTGDDAAQLLKREADLCLKLNTAFGIEDDKLVLKLE